jgi:hypothetical protein
MALPDQYCSILERGGENFVDGVGAVISAVSAMRIRMSESYAEMQQPEKCVYSPLQFVCDNQIISAYPYLYPFFFF